MENFKEKLDLAITFAVKKHEKQKRKGMPWPYIVHLYDVSQTLIKNNASESAIIAGVLHDTVEDTDTTIEEITENFGYEIAYLVDMVSEDKTLKYNDRKKKQAERVGSAGKDVKMIKCADLCSNLTSLYATSKVNKNVWEYFNATKEDLAKNYKEMIIAISNEVKCTSMFKDVVKYFEKVFGEKVNESTMITDDENLSMIALGLKYKPKHLITFKCTQPYARVDGKKFAYCNDCKYFTAKYSSGYFYEDDKYYEFHCNKLKKVISYYNMMQSNPQKIPEECPYIEIEK